MGRVRDAAGLGAAQENGGGGMQATAAGRLLRWTPGWHTLLEERPLPECYCGWRASPNEAAVSPRACTSIRRHPERWGRRGQRRSSSLRGRSSVGRRLDRANGTEDVHQTGEAQRMQTMPSGPGLVPFPFVRAFVHVAVQESSTPDSVEPR
ncbi:hypothetical protein L226DRAFT_77497 [Lentinus tigrinus ALCF2SS1-7]|uniref:uncharacterized protein n=1 Tax=Lentinus tigrinus ALCF2SS1-7 TaxID=1328758 RepID=UPI001166145A|nr:hypothetical protein L226DRAFT_77497 [Lentinus tigrinus ALCF2SS1-7]